MKPRPLVKKRTFLNFILTLELIFPIVIVIAKEIDISVIKNGPFGQVSLKWLNLRSMSHIMQKGLKKEV